MNIALVAAYFFGLLTLKNIRLLYVIFALGFIYILGGKILSLSQSGAYIESELIAPTALSASGKNMLLRLTDQRQTRETAIICSQDSDCIDSQTEFDKVLLGRNIDYIYFIKPYAQLKEWLKSTDTLIDYNSVFRGRYLHHYSVVLYPLREVLGGNIGYAFTSQYGLISLLPLFATHDVDFNFYGEFGMAMLLVIGLFLIFISRKSSDKVVFVSFILIAIALATNIGAIRLSPGFSYIRYFPFVVLVRQSLLAVSEWFLLVNEFFLP
jgi:hypothetical protein